MEKILDIITAKMQAAFVAAGYDASFGRVTVSNRPDLCEYQCNGALAAAKQYKCAPIQIANAVAAKLDAARVDMAKQIHCFRPIFSRNSTGQRAVTMTGAGLRQLLTMPTAATT